MRAPTPSTHLLGEPAALAARFAADGYLWLPGLLPPAALSPLREKVAALLLDLGWRDDAGRARVATPAYDDPGFLRLQRETFASPEMDAIRRHPTLLGALAALLGGPPYPGLGDLVRVRGTGARTRAHQDQHYLRGETDRVTAWLALEPAPLDLGPVSVLAGSHLQGVRPHAGPATAEMGIAPPPDGDWRGGPVAPGDVLLFTALTVHRALPVTRPDALRVSVDFRYGPPRPGGPPPPV